MAEREKKRHAVREIQGKSGSQKLKPPKETPHTPKWLKPDRRQALVRLWVNKTLSLLAGGRTGKAV